MVTHRQDSEAVPDITRLPVTEIVHEPQKLDLGRRLRIALAPGAVRALALAMARRPVHRVKELA